ncbi:MAG: hypothetical protein ABIG20_02945 [archaeon]
MNKPARVILLGDAEIAYKKLNGLVGAQIAEGKENTDESSLLRSINQKVELIKQNPFYGNSIKKSQIPTKYNATNLWRVELSNFWRMLYTIKGDQIEIICFVLDLINHKFYDRVFGYGKK